MSKTLCAPQHYVIFYIMEAFSKVYTVQDISHLGLNGSYIFANSIQAPSARVEDISVTPIVNLQILIVGRMHPSLHHTSLQLPLLLNFAFMWSLRLPRVTISSNVGPVPGGDHASLRVAPPSTPSCDFWPHHPIDCATSLVRTQLALQAVL